MIARADLNSVAEELLEPGPVPVRISVATTLAPATAAPVASVTVPLMVPRDS